MTTAADSNYSPGTMERLISIIWLVGCHGSRVLISNPSPLHEQHVHVWSDPNLFHHFTSSSSGQAARFKTAPLLFPLATCKKFPVCSEILPRLMRRVRHRTPRLILDSAAH